MVETKDNLMDQPRRWRWVRPAAVIGVATLALAAAGAWAFYYYYPDRIGRVQPISFSHRFHVTEKKLSCFMCHNGAINTSRSGAPAVGTCMMCHKTIITTHPEIVKLREAYESGRPVEWVRVNDLPDYCYFDHHVHVRAGFDCGTCHGDVAQMDRVKKAVDIDQMGFCVRCHKEHLAATDCFTCHR
jgi:predicted CXXCH cytochrome family protein